MPQQLLLLKRVSCQSLSHGVEITDFIQSAEKKAQEALAKAKEEADAAAAKAKEEADAAAKAAVEAATPAPAPPPPPEEKKKPIKFKDAVGRKFSFPFHLCSTWMASRLLRTSIHRRIPC